MNKSNIIVLTDADPKAGPPGTDMIFSERTMLRSNLFDVSKLGIAIGLGWGIMFIIISVIVWISGAGTVLNFFELIYPGFVSNTILGILIGFAWSFLYGFISGIIIGIIYNSLVRLNVLYGESWETHA